MSSRIRKLPVALCTWIVLVVVTIPTSRANIFQDMWGIATDPLKLGKASSTLSDSIQRSLTELEQLEGKANYDVAARLRQIKEITDSVVIGTQETIDKATANMLNLEARIDNDALNLIYQAVCAADVTMDQGRRTFADMVADLSESEPGIYLFGVRILNFHTKKISIDKPDDAYNSIKDGEYQRLVKRFNDQSAAYMLVSYYSNLERMAKYTLCFYKDTPSNIIWVQEISNIERLTIPWTTVVLPRLSKT